MSTFLTVWGFVATGYVYCGVYRLVEHDYEIEAVIRFVIATVAIGAARLFDASDQQTEIVPE